MILVPGSSGPMIRQSSRRLSNTGPGGTPVLGADGNAAIGRLIICLGLSVFGLYEVKGFAETDSSGNYNLTIAGAGPNDRYILVAVGDPAAGEFTRALGNMTGGN